MINKNCSYIMHISTTYYSPQRLADVEISQLTRCFPVPADDQYLSDVVKALSTTADAPDEVIQMDEKYVLETIPFDVPALRELASVEKFASKLSAASVSGGSSYRVKPITAGFAKHKALSELFLQFYATLNLQEKMEYPQSAFSGKKMPAAKAKFEAFLQNISAEKAGALVSEVTDYMGEEDPRRAISEVIPTTPEGHQLARLEFKFSAQRDQFFRSGELDAVDVDQMNQHEKQLGGVPLDADQTYIFVLQRDDGGRMKMFADKKLKSEDNGGRGNVQHSSFVSGGPVDAAGKLKVDGRGRLVDIVTSSGHYKPHGLAHAAKIFSFLYANNVDMSECRLITTTGELNAVQQVALHELGDAEKLVDATARATTPSVGQNVQQDIFLEVLRASLHMGLSLCIIIFARRLHEDLLYCWFCFADWLFFNVKVNRQGYTNEHPLFCDNRSQEKRRSAHAKWAFWHSFAEKTLPSFSLAQLQSTEGGAAVLQALVRGNRSTKLIKTSPSPLSSDDEGSEKTTLSPPSALEGALSSDAWTTWGVGGELDSLSSSKSSSQTAVVQFPIYLDHSATTSTDKRVVNKMDPYFAQHYGNPSSNNVLGNKAKSAISTATTEVKKLVHASEADSVLFTGSATESLNHVVRGLFKANDFEGHLITQRTEHPSKIELVEELARGGEGGRKCRVTILEVDENGVVDLKQLERSLQENEDTFLVSIMYANNETGVVQPIQEIARLIREVGASKTKFGRTLFHSDASQAVGKIEVDFVGDKIDYLTLAGHKIYAPKGIGALVMSGKARYEVADSKPFLPQFLWGGSGQAGGLRASTENVPYIVALGEAARLASERLTANGLSEMERLRDLFETELARRLGGDTGALLKVFGATVRRTPTTASIGFYGVDPIILLKQLQDFVIASGAAACKSGATTSHVMEAMGVDVEKFGVVRFSFGTTTTEAEVLAAVEKICDAQEVRARKVDDIHLLAPSSSAPAAVPTPNRPRGFLTSRPSGAAIQKKSSAVVAPCSACTEVVPAGTTSISSSVDGPTIFGQPSLPTFGQPKQEIKLTQSTSGGGCACKIRPDILEKVLTQVRDSENAHEKDANVLVGVGASADDALVYSLADWMVPNDGVDGGRGLVSRTRTTRTARDDAPAMVVSLDFFTPMVDDPYVFGQIAAANSMSDVWAMGAEPVFALNIVGFPVDEGAGGLPHKALAEIIR